LIDLTSGITGVDYRSTGRTLERLDLSGLDAAGIKEKLR
jgi:hypothetical protein